MNNTAKEDIITYAKSDLLCYFASSPETLVEMQNELWLPLLQWIKDAYSVSLNTGVGIRYVEQDAETINIIENLINTIKKDKLQLLCQLTKLTGSFVIAWAVIKQHINIEQAFNTAFLDDNFQINKWGEDDEARKRLEYIKSEMEFISSQL